jgi:hypothetical protein
LVYASWQFSTATPKEERKMKRLHILIFALILGLVLVPADLMARKAYIWTDENGVKRFSDNPPPEGVTDFEVVDTDNVAPLPSAASEEAPPAAEGEEGQAVEGQPVEQDQEAAKKDEKPKVDPVQQKRLLQGEIDTLDKLADKYEAEIEAAQQRLDQEMSREVDSEQSRKQIQYWQERVDMAQEGLDTTNQQISQLESQISRIE